MRFGLILQYSIKQEQLFSEQIGEITQQFMSNFLVHVVIKRMQIPRALHDSKTFHSYFFFFWLSFLSKMVIYSFQFPHP